MDLSLDAGEQAVHVKYINGGTVAAVEAQALPPNIRSIPRHDEGFLRCFRHDPHRSILRRSADDPNEVIVPAVQGTLSVLNSALKHGAQTVKRVVITASCASILEYGPTPRVFTEKDWNERAIREVNEKGKAAANGDKYCASKTLAERAAWDFWNKHKSEVAWDVSVLTPPFVFGPVIHEVDKPENLNESVKLWWNAVVAGKLSNEELATVGYVQMAD